MKRTWKNFKLDKNKVYMRIGQAVVYSSLYIATLVFSYLMFLSGTTYQEGKMEENNKKPNGLQWFALGFSVASLIVALFKQSNYRNNYCDY